MKPLLMILGGFSLTIGTFTAGAVAATALLAAKPVEINTFSADAKGLWTAEPVRVDRDEQSFDRVPGAQHLAALHTDDGNSDTQAPAEPPVDETVTSALPETEEPAVDEALMAAHMDWCSRRYRSFNPADNSYRPYSGGTRNCVSPHLKEAAARLSGTGAGSLDGDEAVLQQASLETSASFSAGLSPSHVQSCQERYRSYRAEDNSYQPYGGGPRRQCE